MFELEPQAYFIIFTLVSLGVAIGQHSHFAMFIYMTVVTLIGFLTWVAMQMWEDDEEHH